LERVGRVDEAIAAWEVIVAWHAERGLDLRRSGRGASWRGCAVSAEERVRPEGLTPKRVVRAEGLTRGAV
jgi:hypothetical protein